MHTYLLTLSKLLTLPSFFGLPYPTCGHCIHLDKSVAEPGRRRLLAAAGENGDCFLMDTRQSKAGPLGKLSHLGDTMWGSR